MPIDEPVSQNLLSKACKGDAEAWCQLVSLYEPLVCHWCQSWGLQPADVDDLRQEVFAAVAIHLRRFRVENPTDTFRGWLHGVTRNKLLARRRALSSQVMAKGGTDANIDLQQVADDTTSESISDNPQAITALYSRIHELIRNEFAPTTWRAFWSVVVDDRAVADVATDLGITPNAVRVAKCRVLHRLREEAGELPLGMIIRR